MASLKILFPFALNFIRYFLIAGFAFLVFYKFWKAKFKANKIQKKDLKKKNMRREIIFSMQTSAIIAVIAIIMLQTPLRQHTQIYVDIYAYPLWWIPLSVLTTIVLHDTYFYWMHRAIHHPKLFRHLHITHHRSTNPSPWASLSFGAAEGILEGMIVPIILLIIPMHPISIILFSLIAFTFNVYGHLGYEIMPKWFRKTTLFKIFNTSVYHNLHHEKFRGNYGYYFRFWDRLMKTENPNYEERYDQLQNQRMKKTNNYETY